MDDFLVDSCGTAIQKALKRYRGTSVAVVYTGGLMDDGSFEGQHFDIPRHEPLAKLGRKKKATQERNAPTLI